MRAPIWQFALPAGRRDGNDNGFRAAQPLTLPEAVTIKRPAEIPEPGGSPATAQRGSVPSGKGGGL